MNTRSWHAVALTIAIAILQSSAGVAYKSPPINRLGQVGLIYTHSAKTMGMGRLSLGLYGNASADAQHLRGVDSSRIDMTGGSAETVWEPVAGYDPTLQALTLHPALAFGFTRFLDLSSTMPVYFDRLEEHVPSGFGGITGGFGDLELAMKFQYPPNPQRRMWWAAYYGAVSIPTGDKNAGYFPRHTYYLPREDTASLDLDAFYTSGNPELDMKMLWTFDFSQLQEASPVEVHVNYGVRWTFNPLLDHLFLLNIAFQYQPVSWLHLFTDFSGEARIRNIEKGFRIGEDPLRLTPGIAFTPEGGFYLSLGTDINLSTDTTNHYLHHQRQLHTTIQPLWRATATIGWSGFVLPQDADQDGIKDNVDKCPNDPEDIDGFEDGDGCPDTDNDNDGIADLKDKCPNDPEDRDNFEDEDGCPDNDNDKDMIADTDDQCPLVPEDLDGFEDGDGCPEADNDQDGIDDTLDHCITIPEDRDGFQDNDGCPDPDNDLDNVPDSLDECPDVQGDASNNGCPKPDEKPRAKEIKRGRVILRGVNFESGKAVLTGDSYAILDRVYESLVEWPEVRVEIRGHTDSVGSAIYNKLLSRRRAGSVRDYLITRGISSDRLVARGMGEGDPIADNQTAAGRALNRRVELHRID